MRGITALDGQSRVIWKAQNAAAISETHYAAPGGAKAASYKLPPRPLIIDIDIAASAAPCPPFQLAELLDHFLDVEQFDAAAVQHRQKFEVEFALGLADAVGNALSSRTNWPL
jgi:hypothetical protein